MDYDSIIKKIFLVKDKRGWDRIESNRVKIILNNRNNKYYNLYNYIINRYNDYIEANYKLMFKENLIRIIYNINKRPVCKKCGKQVKFSGKKKMNFYFTYCSSSCSNSDNYNYISLNKQYEYNLKHYGVKTNFEVQKCKEKRLKTITENYGDNAFKLFYEKCKKTCIERYDVDSPMKLDAIKKKLNNTKNKNHTFNISKPEDECYKLLCNKLSSYNIIRQYKSELYPYYCDFYIKSKNLYIECNFHWTHGEHLFNENNIDDINKLNKWKLKNTRFYNIAINTWTIRDINKYKTAINNKLNYLMFYNMEEFMDWYNKI